MAFVQALDAVLPEIQAGVDGDPLNPWVEIRRTFFCFRQIHCRLFREPFEVRQMPLIDEPVHQRWRQLVEFEKNDVVRHDETPCTDGTGASAGAWPCSAPETIVFTVRTMMTRSSASDMSLM